MTFEIDYRYVSSTHASHSHQGQISYHVAVSYSVREAFPIPFLRILEYVHMKFFEHIRLEQANISDTVKDDDSLSILTMSSPRSRTTSDVIFADFETVMTLSGRPPVGTTRPPLYPIHSDSRCHEKRAGIRLSRQRSRLVNKPIRARSN
jgi:hypothetical protein